METGAAKETLEKEKSQKFEELAPVSPPADTKDGLGSGSDQFRSTRIDCNVNTNK